MKSLFRACNGGVLLATILLFAGAAWLRAENMVFPANAGVINVKNPPYNAYGDGIHDDTAALQAALNAQCSGNKIRYLPNGTYLISRTLIWPGNNGVCTGSGNTEKRTILQGQSQAGVIIKLIDYTPAYGNPAAPNAMIWTGLAPAQRFRNAVRNLTLDIGTGNPGAIGLQFNASNQGTIRDVTIRSTDHGVNGLDFGYTNEIGPLLVRNLTVIGFGIGIRSGNTVNSQTLENVTLTGQTQYGIQNTGQVVNLRNLTYTGAVTAISNSAPGFITLLDGTLSGSGGASSVPAIVNSGAMFARNVNTSGFQSAVQNNAGTGQGVSGSRIWEFSSHGVNYVFPSRKASLNLPVEEVPDVPWDDLSQWDSPLAHGGVGNGSANDAAAIQAAIDSGATTVYLPNTQANGVTSATWLIKSPVYLRGNVRRFIGTEGKLTSSGTGQLVIQDGTYPVVIMERIESSVPTVQITSRTFVISSCNFGTYTNTVPGTLFIDDAVTGALTFNNQTVFGRQVDQETGPVSQADQTSVVKIRNNGGTLWILGLKTERGAVCIETNGGGKTELLGAHIYASSSSIIKTTAIFTNIESSVSLTARETTFAPPSDREFARGVDETRGGILRSIGPANTGTGPTYVYPSGTYGEMFTLYVGYQGTVDVGSSIQVTYSGLVYNRITQQFASTLTLKNIGSNPVPGPIQVVLHGLPAGVTVANAAGTNNGDPYVATDPTVIAPGATVTVLVQFQRTGSQNISYTTRVLSGAF